MWILSDLQKWVRNGWLEGQLRGRLFGGMFCLPWRKSVSWLGEACSLKDNRSHGQREEHLSTHGNWQPVPVAGTRAQWDRPMWLPFRSWTGIKMEDQCEGCLDALQERRDSHTKGWEQQKSGYFQMWSPNHDAKTSNVSLKFAHIFEPWSGKTLIKAQAILKGHSH